MSKYLIENLFGIEGWSIAWYGVIIAVGMVLGVILAIYRARKQGLKDDLIFDFILLALPIAIVCAEDIMSYLSGTVIPAIFFPSSKYGKAGLPSMVE